MAIKNEVTTFRNALAQKLTGFTFMLQQDVKKPSKDLCAIKRLDAGFGDAVTTQAYANKFTFRFVIYGSSELSVQANAEIVGAYFANHNKIKIESESAYFALGSFSCTESFETDTAGIYAIIGLISATRYELREQDKAQTIQQLYASKR